MKISIILLVITFCNTSVQSQIYFKGEILSIKKTGIVKKISVLLPINACPQSWYADDDNDLHVNNKGEIRQVIKFAIPNLIFLSLTNGQLFLAIAEPGDIINFRVLIDSAGRAQIKVLGKDSLAYEYLNHLNHTILKKLTNLKNEQLDARSLLNGVDSIVNVEKTIIAKSTESKFKSILLDNMMEARVLYNMINWYGHTSNNSVKKNENDSICLELYKKFDPLQVKYLPTWTGPINVGDLANAIEENRYQFRADAFQKVDSGWSAISDDFAPPSTFPEPFREDQIGNYILINAIRIKSPFTQRAMLYFAKQYPESKFLPVFQKILASDSAGLLSNTTLKDSTNESKIIFVKDPQTLQNVLTEYAKDKPVLIDCWATWCIYCMVEFPYVAQHENFLNKHNVVTVYLSYDVSAFASSWQNMVRARKLTGVHVLLNKSLEKELALLINFPIAEILPLPRYVLLNRKHEVVNADMFRPSDTRFEQEIINDLSGTSLHNSKRIKL